MKALSGAGLGGTFRAIRIVMLAAAVLWGAAPVANAFTLYLTGDGVFHIYYWVTCNDGFTSLAPPGGVGPAMAWGNAICAGHGGVADFGDDDLLDAMRAIQPSDPPSYISIAEDLGGGSYRSITTDDLAGLLAGGGGEGVELPGYRPHSVSIAGQQLLGESVEGLAQLPLFEAYSNEDDTGPAVGGPLAPAVPIGGLAAVGLALMLVMSGWRRLRTV